MMLHKIATLRICRLCGKDKAQGTEIFKDDIKGSFLIAIINKYLTKEIVNISESDVLPKYVCNDCEQKIITFDEFCLEVSNVQKQLTLPSLEINLTENVLDHFKNTNTLNIKYNNSLICYPDSNSIQNKKKSQKKKVKKKEYSCPVCLKNFRCQAHLGRHELIHTGHRPYVCNICNMSFNQHEIMMKHKESHDGKKKFQCAHCGQTFRYKISLKSHMINYHMELSPMIIGSEIVNMQNHTLQCNQCFKHFATKYKLQRHMRCHTGERPYHCHYCNRSFSQTGNLKLHLRKCQQVVSLMNNGSSHQLQNQINTSVSENNVQVSLNDYQPLFVSETDIQNTINETINSAVPNTSYLNKSYENQLFIDEEIETILEQDFKQMERQKYTESTTDKIPFCIKQPQTPELIKILLYDD